MIDNKIDLTYFLKTKSQANDFTTRLTKIASHLYETDFNLEKELLNEFGVQKKDKLMTLFRTNNINIDKVDIVKNFLQKMQDTINHMAVIDLTIAFEPKEKTLQVLSEWFMMNMKKQMLFNITIDSGIIGGARFGYQGKFLDASIKPAFDKTLQEILTPQQ